ncbi:hypothetical protein CAPTEDRAFT_217275 [Capitella teleta]|uniref:Peptidase C1A papain C-terminal domain-containing protein n=1 Tax=Capitella teleta TaxID=283909 RepID=R7TA10_CAPTE|nr:hypothetical protein CAPTEDRAFT_217275 [Capitella teleta]|eukprot:ELT90593.1 hypothetical protein CAPTEDRAFT_217275 [Capitella teleta]
MVESLKKRRIVSTAQELGLSEEQVRTLPHSVDWRTKGFVSEVQDQGACSSSYAFAALGAVEGQVFNKTGKLTTLSAQNIVDCAGIMLGDGCNGGILDNTLDYIMAFKGVNSLVDYPYIGQLQQCAFNQSKAISGIGGYVILSGLNETLLKITIATVGPVAVTMDASSPYFRYYRHGVLVDPECSSNWKDQNHSVLIVGYGTDEYGVEYWIAKNSWGKQWGMKGYVHLARNHDNMCGLSTHPMYPDVIL